jgi:glycosyltransferase involved in cell wall biosynthesis
MRVVGVEADDVEAGLPDGYWQACRLVEQGQFDEARRLYGEIDGAVTATDTRLRALIRNDLAVVATLEGRFDEARQGCEEAIGVDPGCSLASHNGALVAAELDRLALCQSDGPVSLELAPAPVPSVPSDIATCHSPRDSGRPVKVAIVSFLFNWPSTGGGNMHTAGLAQFLGRTGFEVRHIFARFPNWGIGRVTEDLPGSAEVIEFDASAWNVGEIQARYRRAVEAFGTDYVAITDAWNMKPLLAEAVRGYPYFLLMQAQENLCPLNNLRLLASGAGQVEQCPRNYLATPEVCHRCLAERGHHSGALHQVERALAGVGTPEYERKLRRAFLEAEAVLALNPLTAAMLEPFCNRVRVVPWGLDPARFPWPNAEEIDDPSSGPVGHLPPAGGKAKLFMAAVAGEFIKGFHVAHEACRLLRQARHDFELVVTFDPPGTGPIDEFTRSVGWCSQAELPRRYREADICLVPTIAQDGLSITSVEAMASGIPVVASRIGGVPYTVTDGLTGLLFEPGDPADLARQIGRLLDDPELRRRMGLAGRKRFEEEFTWESVIERYWRSLLNSRRRNGDR